MTDGTKPLPGVLRWSLGDLTITAMNDGWFEAGIELATNISKEEAARLQAEGLRPAKPRVTLNSFLITGPGRKPALIDFGYGGFAPAGTLGRSADAFALTGVRPEEIGTVFLSHLHPDHCGGLVGDDGGSRFPNAELILHEDEAAFWLPDEALSGAPDEAKPYFEIARKAVGAYGERVRRHRGGGVAPGVTAVFLPGHTPGHCGFRIESGGASMLMWTDIVHLPAIQFAQPDAGVAFDVDGDQARETRKRLLDEVAREGTVIAGSHLEFPAIGHVVRSGGGYRFVPALWASAERG